MVRAEREVAQIEEETESIKRLDILVSDGSFVLGIENKVYASAIKNPFHVYDRLLVNRAAGGLILKCVLRPDSRRSDVPEDWPVVSYKQLVDTALDILGHDYALSPLSKWHIFYREFLNHLTSLANPTEHKLMTDAAFTFAIQNFPELRRASELLDQFHSQLQVDATSKVRTRLATMGGGMETEVTSKRITWDGDEETIQIFPTSWGKYSKVVLVYCEDSEKDGPESIDFYVCGYVAVGTESRSLEEVKRKWIEETQGCKYSWRSHADPTDNVWDEGRQNKYVGISALPSDPTLRGALQALEDLAAWMQENAYA
jgi:hypothetical protein